MKTVDLITIIGNLSIALSFVIALVFGMFQVRSAAKDRKERLTLETLHNYHSREFSALLIYMHSDKVPSNMDDWNKLPEEDKVIILQFSQMMEALGLLVAEKYINMDLIDKSLGSAVTDSWARLKPWVMDGREKMKDPYLNEYFQWLAERYCVKITNSNRKPYFEQ